MRVQLGTSVIHLVHDRASSHTVCGKAIGGSAWWYREDELRDLVGSGHDPCKGCERSAAVDERNRGRLRDRLDSFR